MLHFVHHFNLFLCKSITKLSQRKKVFFSEFECHLDSYEIVAKLLSQETINSVFCYDAIFPELCHCLFTGLYMLVSFQSINQITYISDSPGAVGFATIPQDGLVSVQRVRGAECDRSLMIIVGDVEQECLVFDMRLMGAV